MDVLIFNSGYGSRISELIQDSHKSLLNIYGETILSRQLRILSKYEINKVIITTGPSSDKIMEEVQNKNYPFEIVFVHNPIYFETNYIYSMYLASDFLESELLLMHGDLVFDSELLDDLISSQTDSVLVDREKEKYQKDFKCKVEDNNVSFISTQLEEFDFGLQPIYKFSYDSLKLLMEKINVFIKNNRRNVYAEDALNELLIEGSIVLSPIDIDENYCREIDDKNDYDEVKREVNLYDNKQLVITGALEEQLSTLLRDQKTLFIVSSRLKPKIKEWFPTIENLSVLIHDDKNTEESKIVEKTKVIDDYNPDYVVSIGGGTIIDFSKCLIDYSKTLTKHIAVPTTCGTGSESTKFAVYYRDKIKQSLNKNKLLPEIAILDYSLLLDLPYDVLVSSVLDAFAQSIESFWSKKSTNASKLYSTKALEIIFPILTNGLVKNAENLKKLHKASNLAGRAINITTTTAAHALSYNLTQLYGIPHGVAVSMTLPYIWELHGENVKGFDNLMKPINSIAGVGNTKEMVSKVKQIFRKLDIWGDYKVSIKDMNFLIGNVNLERLSNNPYAISKEEIEKIYHKALTH